MSVFSPERLPKDAHIAELKREARATIDAYTALLRSTVFQRDLDVSVLARICADESVPVRERRRAAEVLAKIRLKAMEALADLTAAKEQSLDALGLNPTAQAVALTQVNQKIEIVRAADWRSTGVEIVDAQLGATDATEPADGRTPDA